MASKWLTRPLGDASDGKVIEDAILSFDTAIISAIMSPFVVGVMARISAMVDAGMARLMSSATTNELLGSDGLLSDSLNRVGKVGVKSGWLTIDAEKVV